MDDRNNGNSGSNRSNRSLQPPQGRNILSTLHRALRTRRSSSSSSNSSSSGMISSTTSSPQNVGSSGGGNRHVNLTSRLAASLQSSLNNANNSSSNLNSNNHSAQNTSSSSSSTGGRSRDDDDPSSCQPSSSTSSPQFTSPSPRLRPIANLGGNSLSNSVVVSGGSSSNNNGAGPSGTGGNRNGGPVSPLGSPDSTFWGSSQSSSNYRMGPPTPGGMCVVSSSTADDVPPSPLPFSSDDIQVVSISVGGSSSGATNGLRNSGRSNRSSNSSSNSNGVNQSGNSNGLILNSLINSPVLGGPPPSIPVTSSIASSSRSSSNALSTNSSINPSSNSLGVNFNISRSKIKKASSFERFSMQQAASHQHSQPQNIQQQNSSNELASGASLAGPSRNSSDINSGSGLPAGNGSRSGAPAPPPPTPSTSSASSSSSKILWDSLMQSTSSSSSSSNYRAIFTTNSNGLNGDSKSLHIKIPSKKLAAKIAIEQEEQQQMQQLQQQQHEIMTNLLNQNVLNHPGGSLMNEAIDHLMNDVHGEHDSLIRELSNSPLNLTDSNTSNVNLSTTGNSQSHSGNSGNDIRNTRNSASSSSATSTATSSSPMIMANSHPSTSSSSSSSIKKIPLTPKQKLLHRMQSGELPSMSCSSPPPLAQQLQHQVQTQAGSSSSSSSVQPGSPGLSFSANQQELLQISECLQQQHSPQQPQLDSYVYDTLLRGRDDFVVQDNLGVLSKGDGSDGNNVVLYDQDTYSYYYPNDLGDEIFCAPGQSLSNSNVGGSSSSASGSMSASGNGSSSRGPLLLLSQPGLQEAVDSLRGGQHSHQDFMIGLVDDHGISERNLREVEELDLVQGGSQQQQFADPNDNLVSKSSAAQAESTLRNLLMMGPLQTHEETAWIADYQQQNMSTSGSRSSRQSSSVLSNHSSAGGNINISVINSSLGGGGSGSGAGSSSSSSLQNALNMNLGNSWMNIGCDWQRGSWAPSLGSIGHHDGEEMQDEVMDMSIMDSPEKQQHNKRHMDHDDDVDLGGLPLLSSMPMDLQPSLGLQLSGVGNGSNTSTLLINNKGQQIVLHQQSEDDSVLESNPLNLQHHHSSHNHHHRSAHVMDDEEPVNLMSAVNMDGELSHHSQHPHHSHHSLHHHHSSHHIHHTHSNQQSGGHSLSDDELQHSNSVFQHQQMISNSHQIQISRHSTTSQQMIESNSSKQSEMQCGGYITLHSESQDISPPTQNSSSNDYQMQHSHQSDNDSSMLESATLESSQDIIHQASLTLHHSNRQEHDSEVPENGINIDERRIIRVKKNKDMMMMSTASIHSMNDDSFQDNLPQKTTLTMTGGSIILDKPVQPKSFASLPSPLSLSRVSGNGWAVFTARYKTIASNTRFGPVEGPLKRAFKDDLSNSNAVYPCLVMVDSSNVLWQLDRTDDELCNWMKFVRMARNATESNALVIEDRGLLYFTTTKDVPPKTELQVSYSVDYAQKYGLSCFAGSGASMLMNDVQPPQQPPASEQMSVITQHSNNNMDESSMMAVDNEEICLVEESAHSNQHEDHAEQEVREHHQLQQQEQSETSTTAKTPESTTQEIYVEYEKYVEVYPCFECTDHFDTRELLNEHLNSAHSEPDDAPRKMKKRNLKKMKFLDNAENISKGGSNSVGNNSANEKKATPNSKPILSGILSNGTVKQGRHECTSCKAVLPTLVDLTKHYANHHFEQDGDLSVGSTNGTVSSNTPEKNKEYNMVSSENSDNEAATKDSDLSSKTVSDSSGDAKVTTGGGSETPFKVKCTMCYKSFASKDRLDKHMIVHSDDETKPLKCEFCPKRFLTNSALAGHIKTHAEEGKCFECPMCNFVTQQLLQLKEHVQTHRNKDNGLFHCPKCSKRFSMYSMVRKHIRAFHGPRQFGCDQCIMNFPTADKLKLHKLKHSDHREFLCAECGRQFKRKDKLREHTKRMHENRKKPQLEIQSYSGHLSVKHRFTKKIVPKTAPEEFEKFVYKCMDCVMGFKRRGMLVNHLAKRHPEKPPQQVPELNMPILRPTRNYFCPYCERVYKSSSKRKSHILKSHPGKAVPPQLKGKDSVTVNDGEKLITVSVNSVMSNSNELKSILTAGAAAAKAKEAAGLGHNIVSKMSVDKAMEIVSKEQPKLFSNSQFREVSVVGKVMANPHACQWCHRQYATRAKLLQHQRKSHLHLMPADMQLPRTQKNNVNRANEAGQATNGGNNKISHNAVTTSGVISKTISKKKSKAIASRPVKNIQIMKKPAVSGRQISVKSSSQQQGNSVVAPDSSTSTNESKSSATIITVDSSTNPEVIQQAAASTTTTTITLNEHQLQQLQLHNGVGGSSGDDNGNVIGFLLTTTTLNAHGELSGLVPSEIVVVPVNSHQLQQQSSPMLSTATANAIQQAVLSTTTGSSSNSSSSNQPGSSNQSTSSILPLNTTNSNILTNVISSAVNGLSIVNPN